MKQPRTWGTLHPFFEPGDALGRRMANRDFLRALVRRSLATAALEEFHFFLPTPDAVRALERRLAVEFPQAYGQGRFLVRLCRDLPGALARTDYLCFHLSDPFVGYSELIGLRNRFSNHLFPVTAPTHSLSYREYGERFLHHLWEGTSPRDAVVVTSSCAGELVARVYAGLRERYGLDPDRFPAPALPHIPLGVAVEDFPAPADRTEAGGLREATRNALGAGPDEVIFLTFARISYHSKMDLLPLLKAFKRAEAEGLKAGSYRFLLAGWENKDDHIGDDIRAFCAHLGIACGIERRPDDAGRKALYAAADVFLSPVDSIQETFGLTMLEAAVSSLPVIASDFDGYKDLVLHERTGLLIPTLGPRNTDDTNLRAGLVTGPEYHLRLAQQCAVDIRSLGTALARLGTEPETRERMGREGRKHGLQFSWDAIIDRSLDLWSALSTAPIDDARERRIRNAIHPAQLDYGNLFQGYYSATLDDGGQEERLLRWSIRGEAVYRGKDFPIIYTLVEDCLPLAAVKQLLFAARNPLCLAEARLRADRIRRRHDLPGDQDFLLLWALKQDLLEFV